MTIEFVSYAVCHRCRHPMHDPEKSIVVQGEVLQGLHASIQPRTIVDSVSSKTAFHVRCFVSLIDPDQTRLSSMLPPLSDLIRTNSKTKSAPRDWQYGAQQASLEPAAMEEIQAESDRLMEERRHLHVQQAEEAVKGEKL